MLRSIFIFAFALQISGCATTNTGEAFLLYDDDLVVESIPYFEKGLAEGERISALILALIYAGDTYVPKEINRAQAYYDQYDRMKGSLYDQVLDYYQPFVQSVIWLEDDHLENDAQANKLLKSGQYRTFSPVLSRLGENYAKGIGLKKSYHLSHMLFQQAVENQDTVLTQLRYVWTLATHPDQSYRTADPFKWMPELDEVEQELDFVYHDTLAAVLARDGDYSAAVTEQDVAIQKISRKLDVYPHYQEWLSRYNERKQSYQNNNPWVDLD